MHHQSALAFKGLRKAERYMGTAFILGEVEIDNITVPAGDPGEQLIANLILSVIAFDLRCDAAARRHLAQAQDLALELADRSLVYRPPRPSEFARLTCERDGHTETILLPVINNILVYPAITVESVAGHEDVAGRDEAGAPSVDVSALEITRFILRLRPRRIATILDSLKGAAPGQQLTDILRRILSACTRQELPVTEPLDRANDFFTLARNLLGKRNFPLATLALSNADRALDACAQTASTDHAPVIQGMRDQVKKMLSDLKRTAM
jgi:hypothetical protein